MDKIFSWKEIEEKFNNQWVQLVDYNWPEGEPRPLSGKVRLHAPTRKEFNKCVLAAEPVDAARVYVGKHKLPDGYILSSHIVKVVPCER